MFNDDFEDLDPVRIPHGTYVTAKFKLYGAFQKTQKNAPILVPPGTVGRVVVCITQSEHRLVTVLVKFIVDERIVWVRCAPWVIESCANSVTNS